MFKLAATILLCVSVIHSKHITKMGTDTTVEDTELLPNSPLPLHGIKKISKTQIEHIILKNCSGVIDEVTLRQFPKLSKLTIWRSSIKAITVPLPITRLVSMGSHLPNLNVDLQQNLPHLQAIMLLGNKDFEVDVQILRNFSKLQALHISEANFTETCITKEWFRGLDKLEELGLSDNNIDCVSEDAFGGLKSLRKLDLTYNHITSFEKRTFKKLTKLEQLGLYENSLTFMDLAGLASQGKHLQELGISWHIIKNSNISADDLMKILPNLKVLSFGHNAMPNDFTAGEFCMMLRMKGATCQTDSVFGVARILGYSMC